MPNVSGTLTDRVTGKPIVGAAVWETAATGNAAKLLVLTDTDGSFEIPIDLGTTIAFQATGYTGLEIPPDMIVEGAALSLAPNAILGIPFWAYAVAGLGLILFLESRKKKKR